MGIEERIEDVIRKDGVIEIRGHHIKCLREYLRAIGSDAPFDRFASYDPNYTSEASEYEFQLYRILVENPEIKLKITDEPDFNCKEICPLYKKRHRKLTPSEIKTITKRKLEECDGHGEDMEWQHFDEERADWHGLKVGETYTSGKLVDLLRDIIGG